MKELNFEQLCRLVDGGTRRATAKCVFGYHDGENEHYFKGSLEGVVPENPKGDGGYGWDSVFVPKGYSLTRAQLSEEDNRETYLKIKPFEQLRKHILKDKNKNPIE
jgi:XTP/dITP diphosphohydrolase